jgi:hypothetical protein
MSVSEGAILPVLVCNRRYPRFAIAANGSKFSATMYWTVTGIDRWTADPSRAMRWAEFGGVMTAIRRMEAGEPDDSPGAR